MNHSPLSITLIRNAAAYDFGGGERFPVFLGEELERNGYHVTLLTASQKLLAYADEKNLAAQKVPWWQKQNWSGRSAILFPLYLGWQLYLFTWYIVYILRAKPSVLHIQSKDDFIGATFAGKLLGRRIIWTDHADLKHIWQNICVWYKNPVGKLVYLASFLADAITLVSTSEQKLIQIHLPKNARVIRKFEVVHNGAFDVLTDTQAHDFGSKFTFLVASRLVDDKGIREVINAAEKLALHYSDAQLVLIGDGPKKAAYEHATACEAIHFYGHQSNPLPYIKGADVFVHPTYHEGFSVALVEASMLAKPIIATAVGGNVEIIHDHATGLLVEAKSSESLYAAMTQLIEDKSLRERLAGNARTQYIESFDFSHIVKNRFIPLYKEGKS